MRWTTTGNWKYEECNDYKHWWYTWYTSAGGRREEKRNLRPFTKDMKEDGRLQHFGVYVGTIGRPSMEGNEISHVEVDTCCLVSTRQLIQDHALLTEVSNLTE
jgi:hypothetical protein